MCAAEGISMVLWLARHNAAAHMASRYLERREALSNGISPGRHHGTCKTRWRECPRCCLLRLARAILYRPSSASAGFSTVHSDFHPALSRQSLPGRACRVYKHQQRATLSLTPPLTNWNPDQTITTNIIQQTWSQHAEAPAQIPRRSPRLRTRASHYERSQ